MMPANGNPSTESSKDSDVFAAFETTYTNLDSKIFRLIDLEES